ncbi:MAG: regulatory protein [Polaribacter sp.]|jgi:regulatory protein
MKKEKIFLDKDEALLKLQRYCVYQDRCHQEVRTKLISYGVYGLDLENVITELISENFLNEERFARSYAGGKFRIKKWGRVRIVLELKRRRISAYCIKKGLAEIGDVDYRETLERLLEKKSDTIHENNTFKKNGKLAKFVIGKGYEAHLVWEVIKEKWPNKKRW